MSQRIIFMSAVLLAICGCTAVPLPSRIPLHGWTQVTDNRGELLPVEGDFLKAAAPDSEGTATARIGLHLQPGDVIYLRRWSPGRRETDEPIMNHATPVATGDRIPLRWVAEREGNRLYDYEREFLINVLTTHRTSQFSQVQDRLADALRTYEVPLWNALLRSLIVKRSVGSDSNLVLTVRMTDFLQGFPEEDKDLRAAFLDPEGAVDPDTGERLDRDSELTALGSFVPSPYHALGGPPRQNGHYYSNRFPFPRFNYLSIELSEARMARPASEESQWTLQEWEESGICFSQDAAGNPHPAAIRWVQLTTSKRIFHVVPEDRKATHRVWTRVTDDVRERRLEPTESVSWGYSAISKKDLDKLTLRDVQHIRWSAGSGELVHPDNCQIP